MPDKSPKRLLVFINKQPLILHYKESSKGLLDENFTHRAIGTAYDVYSFLRPWQYAPARIIAAIDALSKVFAFNTLYAGISCSYREFPCYG